MTALSFDNVSLIPRVISDVESRSDVDTSVQFGPRLLQVPFLASPMPDVMGVEMANTISHPGTGSTGHGGLGFIHRFQTPEAEVAQFHDTYNYKYQSVGVSIGVGKDESYRIETLYQAGARIFLIDVANGASERVVQVAKDLKATCPGIFLVAGNVASREGFKYLSQYVDAIRVGIAGGSVCTTGPSTGIHVPTLQSIYECSHGPKQDPFYTGLGVGLIPPRPLIIADGGIRNAADACKALALGADLVMCGSLFAGTKESPGPVVMHNGEKHKMYRGAASYGVQYGYDGAIPNYIEGAETLVPYKGSVVNVLKDLENGLRSSMSYFGAHTLQEYRENADYILL